MENLKKFICRNGVDKLNMSTNFRQASYAAIHTYDYVDRLDGNSNNSEYNAAGYDSQTNDELSSTLGISGIGLTLGLIYSL
jgi:hypothetical protein